MDNDCDELIDDADDGLVIETASSWYADADADGCGDSSADWLVCLQPSGTVSDDTDCDDASYRANPGSTEVCNGFDDDCDGTTDGSSVCSCNDGTTENNEEYDPSPGPYNNIVVDSGTCRWDFTSINQLYCSGSCSWDGSRGCDQQDADILCQLTTDNPSSTATSWTATTALAESGFSCGDGRSGSSVNVVNRGVSHTVYYRDSSLLAAHGAGDVIAYPVCTDP